MKKKTIASIAISAVFLYIALRGISASELANSLKQCNFLYVIPALLVTVLLFVIRALRWHYLVKPIKKVGFKNLFSATMIGFMANNIFPARIGEFVRANVLGNDENISKSSVFATIVIERLFDGMTLLLILVATFFAADLSNKLSPDIARNFKRVGIVALVAYILIIAVMVLLSAYYQKSEKFILTILKPFPKSASAYISKLLASFKDGLRIEKNLQGIFLIIFYSLLHWALCALPIYLVFKGFGHNLPLEAAFVTLIMISFAVMVPAAPGYVGTLNLAVMGALRLYGLTDAQGFSVSVIIHIANFVPPVAGGLLLIWLKNISMRAIKEEGK